MTVYNPKIARTQVLRIKVPHAKFDVLDSKNNNIQTDVICGNATDMSDCDAFFFANLLGF